MKAKTKVFIVDDHVMVREGFVTLVNQEDDMEVCGQSDSARETLSQIEQRKPDVLVIDIILKDGDGLELIKDVHSRWPQLAMLVVSMQDEEIYAKRALRAGARGYIMKFAATEEFLLAIRAVVSGQLYISKKMNARILHEFLSGSEPRERNMPDELTDRELEIFQAIGSGMPTRDIAARLGISRKTIESHRENMKEKLGLDNAAALVRTATAWVQKCAAPDES